jgi:aspartate carbamoyltransferase catalytic subunit
MIQYRENRLRGVEWSDLESLPPAERAPYFMNGESVYHVLFAQQFNREFLDRICELATRTRRIAKTRGGMMFLKELLAEKRAMLYFAQPSSRTFLSFLASCEILGLHSGEVRDSATSSEVKGESPEDTVRTFSSYFDMIIMRHPQGGFAERIAWLLSNSERPIPVINAGSGADQHPTQALLDVYTLQRSFEGQGGIEGKKIAFVGDLARGRTVRSLATLMTHYPGVHLSFIAPPSLQIDEKILRTLDSAGIGYELGENLVDMLPDLDAVYMTRIQDEWDTEGESVPIDVTPYAITVDRLARMKDSAVIMHPLPRRGEISPEVDSDPRAKYWRQVRNGMWIRASLIMHILDRDGEVDRYYDDLVS